MAKISAEPFEEATKKYSWSFCEKEGVVYINKKYKRK